MLIAATVSLALHTVCHEKFRTSRAYYRSSRLSHTLNIRNTTRLFIYESISLKGATKEAVLTADDCEETLQCNALGPALLTKLMLERLRQSRGIVLSVGRYGTAFMTGNLKIGEIANERRQQEQGIGTTPRSHTNSLCVMMK